MKRLVPATALATAMTALAFALPATAQQAGQKQGNQEMTASGSCPQQFSSLQTPSNDTISRAEADQVQIKVFEALDANGDDVVSRDEYVECLIQSPAFAAYGAEAKTGDQNAAQQRAAQRQDGQKTDQTDEQRFSAMDGNGDGNLSWEEYMTDAQARYEKSDTKGSEAEAASSASWEFARRDADLDGQLSQDEFTADPSDPTGIVDKSFQALDTDKNQSISKEEYTAGVRPAEPAGAQSAAIPVWEYRIWRFD